eukprot:8368832-Pyramimonas_sp.AAC.1
MLASCLIDAPQHGPKSAPEAPKSASRGPEEAPRRPKQAPKRPPICSQETPERPPEALRGTQDAPRALHWGALPLRAAHFPDRGNSSGH